ncbi:PXDN [Lepeophtheirus salmonis]|uniref:PXDN n=1 Tax=Lepeophtheirus salmonis TaxID=72036 RepID=A0A7R8HER5_LEPSM|nr:PXDN [Lepeophtheirus salmonis]CAF3033739.1 PXDN [Lepeophtheirus salmonis]
MKTAFIYLLTLTTKAFDSNSVYGNVVFSNKARSGRVEECKTTDGIPCVFPFEYGGKTYKGCTVINDPESLPWCSTRTYSNGTHIGGKGFWGHCSLDCPDDSRVVFEENDDIPSFFEPCEATLTDGTNANGECLPLALCTTLSFKEENLNECTLPNGGDGLCCIDTPIRTDDTRLSIVLNSEAQNPPLKLPSLKVSLEDVDNAIEVSDIEGIIFGDEPTGTDDDELVDDPEGFHLRFNAPVDRKAEEVDHIAVDFVDTANKVKEDNNLSDAEAGIGLRSFDIDSSNEINNLCPWSPPPKCEPNARYRSADGTCNNLKNPNMGRAKTPYQRILLPEYSEGSLQLPRRSKVRNTELPSARDLSVQLTQSNDDIDPQFTVLVMQMGQFIDHDLTHTPNHGIRCCGPRGSFPDTFDGSKCFPIPISENDPFWKGKKRCLSLARSLSAPGLKCELEFRQQMNQITHWLDASNIYGSTKEEMDHLRLFKEGKLSISTQSGTQKGSLPSCSAAPAGVGMCRGCKSCFFAGDIRANEQHNLIVMHTVWIREHNRIASFLGKLNSQWSEEKLFQESRRIVTAEYQHIILKEWLPSILGNEFMTTYGLWPLQNGHSTQYLDIDSRITNEFATAAFRFGHSLIPSKFSMKTFSQGRSRSRATNLKDLFFKPHQIKSSEDIDGLIRGMEDPEQEVLIS